MFSEFYIHNKNLHTSIVIGFVLFPLALRLRHCKPLHKVYKISLKHLYGRYRKKYKWIQVKDEILIYLPLIAIENNTQKVNRFSWQLNQSQRIVCTCVCAWNGNWDFNLISPLVVELNYSFHHWIRAFGALSRFYCCYLLHRCFTGWDSIPCIKY